MSSLREKISEAAQELYLREGMDGVSMRKVAEQVGVSAPAIYRHFKNKDELLNEIVVRGLKILEEYLLPALDEPSPYDRLTRMIENYLRFALEQPKYFDCAFLVPSREITGFAEEIARPDWSVFRMCVDEVAACVEQGTDPGDPLETAITLWAGVHGLVTLYRTGRFGPDPDAFRQIYGRSVERMLDGLRIEPAER